MRFSLAPLLLHSAAISDDARDALRTASLADPERRDQRLEQAARILFRDTDLGCSDVRELVGLPPGDSCGETP